MLTVLLCAVFAIAAFCPDSSIGRRVNDLLVKAPARTLLRLTPGQLVVLLVAAALITALFVLLRTEAPLLAAQFGGETVAWFFTFDVATYVDVMAVAWLLAATARVRLSMRRSRELALGLKRLARDWASKLLHLRDLGRRPRSARLRHNKSRSGEAEDGAPVSSLFVLA